MVYAYDIEIFPNFFSITFIPVIENQDEIDAYIKADINKDYDLQYRIRTDLLRYSFVIAYDGEDSVNDLYKLHQFIKSEDDYKPELIIGYNNIFYDDVILDYILSNYNLLRVYSAKAITKELYDLSYSIINYPSNSFRRDNSQLFKNAKRCQSVDLFKMHYLDEKGISLKQVAISLKWYKIQESSYGFEETLPMIGWDKTLDYNINDVLITRKLFIDTKDEFAVRAYITRVYGVPVYSSSRSGTADKLLAQMYSDMTGLTKYEFLSRKTDRPYVDFRNVISNKVYFRSKELADFLRKLFSIRIDTLSEDKFSEILLYKEKGYKVATGGLHSVDRPAKFHSTNNYIIRDADVTSFYPRIILNEGIAPAHLHAATFLQILEIITTNRIKFKEEGRKLDAEALKIVINAIFGKLGSPWGWLYDPLALYKTTVNGQLFLLMLIERLETAGIEVISANTDGIVCKVYIDKEDEYYRICKEWSDETNFHLEFTDYNTYVRTTVNDYFCIKENGDIKSKGDFVIDLQIDKGYYHPIIPKAIRAFYLNNDPIDDFLRASTDIYDFCISQKTGREFINQYLHIDKSELKRENQQKTLRYYVSNNGGTLLKLQKNDGREIKLISGYNVRLFNDYYPVNDMKQYDINYNFYKKKCYDVINNIEGATTKSKTGKLFDEF